LPTSQLPAELVADANVVLSAAIGGRARLVFVHPRAPRIVGAAAHIADEVTEHLPALARRRRLDDSELMAAFGLLPIVWQDVSVYSHRQP